VPRQIALPVTVNVEPPHHPPALHRLLPDRGADRPPLPRDVARQSDIDREQACHRFHPHRRHRGFRERQGSVSSERS